MFLKWEKTIGLHTSSYSFFFTIALSHSYNILAYCNSFLTNPFDSKACLPNLIHWLLSDVFQKYFLVISLLKIISESSLSENIHNMCLVLSHHCPQMQLFHRSLLKIAWVWTRWSWVSNSTLIGQLAHSVPQFLICWVGMPIIVPPLEGFCENEWIKACKCLEWCQACSTCSLNVRDDSYWCPCDFVLAVCTWHVSLFLHIQLPVLFKDRVRWLIFMKFVWWLKLNVML